MKMVFFDVGDVLIRVDNEQADRLLLSKCRRLPPMGVGHALAHIYPDAFYAGDYAASTTSAHRKGEITTREFVARSLSFMQKNFDYAGSAEDFLFAYNSVICGPIPENVSIFETLARRQGLCVGIISDNNDCHVSEIKKCAPAVLTAIPKDRIFLSHEVGLSKHDDGKAMFEDVLSRVGLSPKEAVMIDDRLDLCEVAQSIGMSAIHLPLGTELRKQLNKVGITL